ncbi:hypothetical protein BC938DRAFT_474637 [Jimgerdemannia flammicorona]|uniref:ERAP1-like C-terminal domain-containing protein n=1 Tax=Jimgerdemannia flammicorona TaxID=994334 RepID=A0A433QS98_9FUNG|nr:hypothetical protein BC938DRAFT_474637 [Jimgerdemannia flammicorona]
MCSSPVPSYSPLPIRLSKNSTSRITFWEWLTANFDAIESRYSEQSFIFGTLLNYSIEGLGSHQRIQEAENFLKRRNTKAYQRALDQGLESARIYSRWVERDREDVAAWFNKEGFI